MTALLITRRTILVASLSAGIVGSAFAQTPLQVKQSFINSFPSVFSNANFHSQENYFQVGIRRYLKYNTSTVNGLHLYNWYTDYVDFDAFGNSSRISLTAKADWEAGVEYRKQCIGFVKAVIIQSFTTGKLTGGTHISPQNLPQPFSIIGVFGTPGNDSDYNPVYYYAYGHVAIYLGEIPTNNPAEKGIIVLDQNHDEYGRGSIALRTMKWNTTTQSRTYNPNHYRVVMKK